MRRISIILLISCLLAACSKNESAMNSLPDVNAVRLNLAFTCSHEVDHLPPLDPEADKLFEYGRYLQKKEGEKDFGDVARYYRIAAAHGHYKANHNLQILISSGAASSPDPEKESVDLAEQLIKAGVPSGYYDIGHYLLSGYGLQHDEDAARRYIRKAADLGNADAQYYVANLLDPADAAPDIARQMFQCAADQGHADAANYLGVTFQNDKDFMKASQAFQKSVEAGSSQSALLLEESFDAKAGRNPLYALGAQPDAERSRRYNLIGVFLRDNDGRNPKVPDIDKIVPLPPAKLPPWDGTFQWQKEQDAATPPQKPSDEFINEMAKAKHLDPATGLPLPGSADKTSQAEQPENVASRLPLGTVAHTGQTCPEDGVWCAKLGAGQFGDTQRRFLKGDALPSVVVHEPRKLAVLDSMMGTRQHVEQVAWELVAYLDQA
ncbi:MULTISPECIES: SEL1-like repeat protein [Burkholderia]|uniref:SEL1-like repeat protein n=1 Tax=Burkholderia TaxID=32008 RepID=UPI001C88E282|nr:MULTISPECIES: sel1 repeat family protein [Burkholderia]MDI9687665.1 sel1 repeat family protein [Burkholderia cenocepacia]MDN7627935.1 sel1 repeat family protein [Burkholderia cenocepacia]MDT6997969.1 sel1 repeat family protein [Burkholderia cenocepacia]